MRNALGIGKTPDIIPLVGGFLIPPTAQVGEGSRKPQQGMKSEETESSQEQGRHPPECEIKNRVFRFVVMGCVGQVTGKAPVCIGMTFLAGLDDLIEPDMRIRIVHTQDIMSPVTIGTFSRFQVSQSIRLAVHGV